MTPWPISLDTASPRSCSGQATATDIDWAAAAGAGAGALAFEAQPIETIDAEAAQALLDASGLAASTIHVGLAPLCASPIDAGTADQVRSIARVAITLGAEGVLVTTGPREGTVTEADAYCAAWVGAMAPVAAEIGTRVLLEPTHPILRHYSYVNTLTHGAELYAHLPGTGVLADTGHLWWGRHLLDDIAAHVGAIRVVQIDDVDGDALANFAYRRVQLGEGTIPLAEIVGALETAGFDSYYENEIIVSMPRVSRVSFLRTGGERLGALIGS